MFSLRCPFFQKNHRKGVAYMIFLLFLSRQYHIDIVFDFTSPKEKGMMANGKASQLSVSQSYAHSTHP